MIYNLIALYKRFLSFKLNNWKFYAVGYLEKLSIRLAVLILGESEFHRSDVIFQQIFHFGHKQLGIILLKILQLCKVQN